MTAILEMRGITKTFPGVKALENVNLRVESGEIHALVGENGAGKSTLMKVLSGVYPHGSYTGEIWFQGEERRFTGIADSEKAGIVIIHQELALVPLLSIAENIFLGNEQAKYGVIDWSAVTLRTRDLLRMVGLERIAATLITDIGVGKQQLVEIAKALSKEVKLLILDEPTASLNESDSDALLNLLLEFKKRGHFLDPDLPQAQRDLAKSPIRSPCSATAARSKPWIAGAEPSAKTGSSGAWSAAPLADRYPKRDPKIGEMLFEVKDWNVHHQVHADRLQIKNVSMNVRRGEIVGIAGLMGAGRTEFAMSVFGRSYGRRITGKAYLNGKEIDVSTIRRAVDSGLAYVTEDRKHYGLVLNDTIMHNISLANLGGISRGSVLDDMEELAVANTYRRRLNIRSSSVLQQVVNLSGGNQQKVVLSKWLFSKPEVLILDEPTRGIDVGAKYEIYTIINQLADEGKGVIMISSEMPELLGVCDRIYVMNEGRFVAEMPAAEASQEKIMRAIMRGRDVTSSEMAPREKIA